jgi:membrane protease YdiL (CAAX protease family)
MSAINDRPAKTNQPRRPLARHQQPPSPIRPPSGPSNPIRTVTAWIRQIDNPLPIALFYLAFLTIAELATVITDAWVGQALHLVLLFLLLLHMTMPGVLPLRRFLLGLTFVPLIRVISLSLPLTTIPRVYWYFVVSIPLFAAIIVALRSLGIRLRLRPISLRSLPSQLAFALSGLLFGYIEFLILRPDPLITDYNWTNFAIAAGILFVSTGLLEEVIFRGIMQQTSIEQLGRWPGILYAATIFAILHIGYQSILDVLFVLLIGIIFGWYVSRTRNLLGVTLSHGLTNTVFFLVIPYWLSAHGPLPFL